MESREWILRQLGMSLEQLFSNCRRKGFSDKRWLVVWFYRASGKTYPYIARMIGKDQSSVRYACENMSPTIKALAEEYLFQYITEELHEKTDFIPMEKPKVKVRVPDYKHSVIVEADVDFDKSKKEFKKIRRWDL